MDKRFSLLLEDRETGDFVTGEFDTYQEYHGQVRRQKRYLNRTTVNSKVYIPVPDVKKMCEQVLEGNSRLSVYAQMEEELDADVNFKASRHYRHHYIPEVVTHLLDREDLQEYIKAGLTSRKTLTKCETVSKLIRELEKVRKEYDYIQAQAEKVKSERERMLTVTYQSVGTMVDQMIQLGHISSRSKDKYIGTMMLQAGATVDEVVRTMDKTKASVRKWQELLRKGQT